MSRESIAWSAGMLGYELPADQAIDSRDTMAAFLGEDDDGLPFMIEEARRLALRVGDWKFVQRRPRNKKNTNGKPELYDLSEDPGESTDLSEAEPARLAAMLDAVAGWESELEVPRWGPGSEPASK